MDRIRMAWARVVGLALLVVAGGLTACVRFDESGLPGSASSMARNQIMWIQEAPPTFGYHRMRRQMNVYPDMSTFVNKNGIPDFMAETENQSEDYFILYYLEDREAFACRNRFGSGRRLEFSGPYPVTDKEYQLLDNVRKKEVR